VCLQKERGLRKEGDLKEIAGGKTVREGAGRGGIRLEGEKKRCLSL